MTRRIRVLVVDDHLMFAEALQLLLDGEPEMLMVGAAGTAEEAIERCRDRCPDVVLMDLDLPGKDGIEGTRQIRRVCPDARVVLITAIQSPDAIARAIEAGACGYLFKTQALDDLVGVIRRAAAGEMVLSDDDILPVIGKIQQTRSMRSQAMRAREQLTSRELQILEAFAQGKSTAEVAEALYISRLTVQSHVKSILAKLGAHSKLEAVAFALRHNLIQIPQTA